MDKTKVENEIKKSLVGEEHEVEEPDNDGKKKAELEWFLVKGSSFAAYDKVSHKVNIPYYDTYQKREFDDNNKPAVDKNGNPVFKTVNKSWVEIALPFSKDSEFIRVPKKWAKPVKNGYLWSIALNKNADEFQVYTASGKKVVTTKKQVLSAFKNNQTRIEKELEDYHKSQENKKELEKEK